MSHVRVPRAGMTDSTHTRELGERLARAAPRLRLLLAHLAGSAVRRRVDVDDLVQEVLVRALASPASMPPREPVADGAVEPALWRHLAQLARHTTIDVARALRADKRAGALDAARLSSSHTAARSGVAASRLVSDATGPASVALRRETTRDLVRAFEQLAPEHRRVLGLRQFEGLSAAECGRRLGKSEVAVHSLYRRALAAWSERLGRDPSL